VRYSEKTDKFDNKCKVYKYKKIMGILQLSLENSCLIKFYQNG